MHEIDKISDKRTGDPVLDQMIEHHKINELVSVLNELQEWAIRMKEEAARNAELTGCNKCEYIYEFPGLVRLVVCKKERWGGGWRSLSEIEVGARRPHWCPLYKDKKEAAINNEL